MPIAMSFFSSGVDVYIPRELYCLLMYPNLACNDRPLWNTQPVLQLHGIKKTGRERVHSVLHWPHTTPFQTAIRPRHSGVSVIICNFCDCVG